MSQQFSKAVERITVFETAPGGGLRPVTLYKPTKKKGSRGLREIEKIIRRVAEAQQTSVSNYLERHNRSNEEEKDGWLHDLGNNVYKAMKAGNKTLTADDEEDDDDDDDDDDDE